MPAPKACLPRGGARLLPQGLAAPPDSAGRRSGLRWEAPRSVEQLRQLPGIGPYTASAVAAFAFGADEIALDGNLRRVLARLIDLPVDPRTPDGEARLLRQARRHLPSGKASAFNQALMDLARYLPAAPPAVPDLSPSVDMPGENPGRPGDATRPRPVIARAPAHRHGRCPPEARSRLDRPPTGRRPAGRIVGIPRREMLEARDGRGVSAARAARGTGHRGRGRRLAGDLPAFLHPFPRHDARLRVPPPPRPTACQRAHRSSLGDSESTCGLPNGPCGAAHR